jgi:tRNA(Ile)-lysidine synthase TilS/MesJ
MAAGNKHLRYKEALNAIEAESPGTKHAFYHEFLARAADRFAEDAAEAAASGTSELGSCTRCGSPSPNEVCAFCLLVERTAGAVPVTLGERRGGPR